MTATATATVLVIGGGGREHALAWKLARSPQVGAVFVAPGNAGTGREPGVQNVAIDATDVAALAAFAAGNGVTLTVVGPEAALAAGVVDAFEERGLRIFGPTRAAARLESSKAHAKAFMQRHAIPTAAWAVFGDAAAAHARVDAAALPVVVKADGLAAGKGVVVATTREEAHAAIDTLLGRGTDADADARVPAVDGGGCGSRVVIEDFLAGEEASFIVVSDGRGVLPLATSQDHKRLRDGDRGPNTGGMGAYSPAPVVTAAVQARVMREIVEPTLAGMRAEGTPFTGFLYVGLMIDEDGAPRVVEYNARLGDPETQPLLLRLRSDLFELLMRATAAAAAAPLSAAALDWDARPALGVVVAAAGYPDRPRPGDVVRGLPDAASEDGDAKVFHAGTMADGEGVVRTSGGRVLCVTALGTTLRDAGARAYGLVDGIAFDGAQVRRDIGHRGVDR